MYNNVIKIILTDNHITSRLRKVPDNENGRVWRRATICFPTPGIPLPPFLRLFAFQAWGYICIRIYVHTHVHARVGVCTCERMGEMNTRTHAFWCTRAPMHTALHAKPPARTNAQPRIATRVLSYAHLCSLPRYRRIIAWLLGHSEECSLYFSSKQQFDTSSSADTSSSVVNNHFIHS